MCFYLRSMKLILTLSPTLIIFGFLSFYSVFTSDLILHANSADDNNSKKTDIPSYPDVTSMQAPVSDTQVEIVKSFKNSSGFYKIDGTLENHHAMILTDIQVTKYYKIPSVNDTTLICYEQDIVNCQYKSNNDQLPSKSLFLSVPPAMPPQARTISIPN